MDERLRSVSARISGRIKRLRGDDDENQVVVSHIDDDPDAEPLPPLAVPADDTDDELQTLDAEDAPPVEIPEEVGLLDLFEALDPLPPLPLTAPHDIALSEVVVRLSRQGDAGLLQDRRVRRVMDLLGDRLKVTVSPEGITVRGVLRSRHTAWKHLEQLSFTSRYDLLRGGLVAKTAKDYAGKLFPLPVPGLEWLLRRLVGGVVSLYERRLLTADQQEDLRAGLGHSLTDIERRGLDIELTGALRVLMFFSFGLSEAIKSEAADRGIKVVGLTD